MKPSNHRTFCATKFVFKLMAPHLAAIGEQLRRWCCPLAEALEGGVFGEGVQVPAAQGEALLCHVTGDLQHLQLHLADAGRKLQVDGTLN